MPKEVSPRDERVSEMHLVHDRAMRWQAAALRPCYWPFRTLSCRPICLEAGDLRSARGRTLPGSLSDGLSIAIIAASCAVAIAACGSSSTKASNSTAGSSQHSQEVSYADCMRSHAVPNFPDPSPGGGFALGTSGINQQSPAFLSAQHACAHLQPGGNSQPPPISAAQQAGMVANSRCIRTHGVPNFPDPTFGPGGEGAGVAYLGNASAPAFQKAVKTCSHVGTPIPGV